MTEPEDHVLVRRFLASRDEAVFRMLYQCQTPMLYRVAARLVAGSSIRPEDVVQETWLRGITRLVDFRFESKLGTWLVAIVINITRELHRTRADVIPFESLVDVPDRVESDPARIAENDIAPLLERLPEGYLTVLILHDLEGFTHAEIATALGIVPGTAKSQLSRARAAARALLESPSAGFGRR
ncbi:MAG: RNA polymerase sigma factor [Terriglobales bacterium]